MLTRVKQPSYGSMSSALGQSHPAANQNAHSHLTSLLNDRRRNQQSGKHVAVDGEASASPGSGGEQMMPEANMLNLARKDRIRVC